METTTLKLTSRSRTGKGAARTLRRSGAVPGVVYGESLPSQPVGADPRDVVRILRSSTGQNTVLSLELEGGEPQLAIIRDYQVHPFKRKLLHVDFMRVTGDTELVVTVPVHLHGHSEAVYRGARLSQVTREIKVRCRASAIPAEIAIDISSYEVGSILYAFDTTFPEGVEPAYRNNFPIFSISHVRVEIEEEDEDGDAEGAEAAEAPAED